MKEFTFVVKTNIDELKVLADVREYIENEYNGEVFIRKIFLNNTKPERG
ncbi:MAG: hypothetical protein ABIG39_06310 [Candidatus Micrarchaeota archaeon]